MSSHPRLRAVARLTALAVTGATLILIEPACVVRARGGGAVVWVVDEEPPPPRIVTMAPRPGYLWIDGHWERVGSRWTWREGYWMRERAGHEWRPGAWVRVEGRWHWHAGAWQPRAPGPRPRVQDHR